MSNVDAGAWLALGQPSRPQRTQISVDGKPSVSGHSRRERRYACSSWYCPALNVVLSPVLELVLMALDQSVGRIQLRSTPGALGGGHLFG